MAGGETQREAMVLAWNSGSTKQWVLDWLINDGLVVASEDRSDGMIQTVYTRTEAGKAAGLVP